MRTIISEEMARTEPFCYNCGVVVYSSRTTKHAPEGVIFCSIKCVKEYITRKKRK